MTHSFVRELSACPEDQGTGDKRFSERWLSDSVLVQPLATKFRRKKAYIDPNISLNLDTTDLAGGRLSQVDNIWVSQGPTFALPFSSQRRVSAAVPGILTQGDKTVGTTKENNYSRRWEKWGGR